MRKAFSFICRLLPSCFPIVLPLLSAGSARAQTAATDVDYTGSLLGYYRMEFKEPDDKHLEPVKAFLKFRENDQNRLLLGMGDNFGPEFGAALQLENGAGPGPDAPCYLEAVPSALGESRPESLYKDDGRVPNRADCDNVLNFLMHAGFRALVPGAQDFMYTARWLRVSALRLAEANEDETLNEKAEINNLDHQTQLLGANLRISMKSAPGGQRGGVRCPLLFSKEPLGPGVRCVGDGSQPETLDWLDRLDRLNSEGGQNTISALQVFSTQGNLQVAARQTALDELIHDEISILESAWGLRLNPLPDKNEPQKPIGAVQRISEAVGTGALTADAAGDLAGLLDRMTLSSAPGRQPDPADLKEFQIYRDRMKVILTNLSRRLRDPKEDLGDCVRQRSTGGCFVLSPDARAAAINGLLRTIAIEEKGIGYTVARSGNGGKVLIVGVVGPDTMNAVSATNLRLCPVPKRDPKNPVTPTTAFGPCGDRTKAEMAGYGSTVLASDPVSVAQALVRAAVLMEGRFDSVIVMAQMPVPEAEILSERVWKRLNVAYARSSTSPAVAPAIPLPTPRYVDVVISEAESGYATQELTLRYPAPALARQPSPVVTPDPSYSSQDGSYPGAVSRLTIESAPDQSLSLANRHEGIIDLPSVTGSGSNLKTTVSLLYQLLADLQGAPPPPPALGTDLATKQRTEFALLKDLQSASPFKVDVVLLQSRDAELNAIGPGYTDYNMCQGELQPGNTGKTNPREKYDLCRLRVALDRIFWKGDYVEYVAVTGRDLKNLLGVSQKLMAQQAQLADTGPTGEWLISYGIVQSALSNVTEINQNNEPVWIPADPSCKGQTEGQTAYCVGGTPIADDAYYWLLTTDQLAQDKAIYSTLENLPAKNHKETNTFVTAPLSHFLEKDPSGFLALAETPLSSPPATAQSSPGSAQSSEALITRENQRFQQAPLWQVDFAKVVASFSSRQPVGGNSQVVNFQGVSDPRASAPASQDMDLELSNRVTGSFFGASGSPLARVSIGEQSTFAYDRAVIGNLQGRPINASYSLNNFTEGAFIQVRLGGSKKTGSVVPVRSLPRSLLVFTPHQYQIEINHPYLFFPYSAGATGELTVELPRISGWTDRAGFREEFGLNKWKYFFQSGSYLETGFEFSSQNANLESLTLQTGSAPAKTCIVQASVTLQNCFSSGKYGSPQTPLTINSTTVVVGSPVVKTLHTPGVYWTFHFQNRLWQGKRSEGGPAKQINLVTDSQGDYYFGRPPSAELFTQTRYAIPLSVAIVLPSIGNLSFAPTYSGFFYQSQKSNTSLQVNSFSIAARWYFARDARVPIRTQTPLIGPQSADQTKTGKGH